MPRFKQRFGTPNRAFPTLAGVLTKDEHGVIETDAPDAVYWLRRNGFIEIADEADDEASQEPEDEEADEAPQEPENDDDAAADDEAADEVAASASDEDEVPKRSRRKRKKADNE